MGASDSAVLEALGLDAQSLLGSGGEARIYALDGERVLRVPRPGANDGPALDARIALLRELRRTASRLPFAIPEVLETREIAGRRVVFERRLPGRPLDALLPGLDDTRRGRLVRAYLEAAARVGDLEVAGDGYGDLARADAIHARSFRRYLAQRAAASLGRAGPAFADLDPHALADALPEPARPALVHLDVFPANVLTDGESITAVLDFSVIALRGDRRLDPLAATVYLEPTFTPGASDADRSAALAWLGEHDLEPLLQPARRWLAAFWSAATHESRLHAWARSVLDV